MHALYSMHCSQAHHAVSTCHAEVFYFVLLCFICTCACARLPRHSIASKHNVVNTSRYLFGDTVPSTMMGPTYNASEIFQSPTSDTQTGSNTDVNMDMNMDRNVDMGPIMINLEEKCPLPARDFVKQQ